jgi:hypothetical protein
MFNVDNKHLPETTRLNDREIAALTLEYVYDQLLKGSTQSVFELHSNRLMKHKIGRNGDGRTEYFTYSAAKAAEKAASEFEGRGL